MLSRQKIIRGEEIDIISGMLISGMLISYSRKSNLNVLGYGIEDGVLGWLRSYEQTARQRVCHVNRVTSSMATKTWEVPQGSILGPLLFLVFVNHFSKSLDYGIARLFAVDSNLTFSG